jgi:hypothetical protein
LTIRTKPKTFQEIAEQTSLTPGVVEAKMAHLALLDLVVQEDGESGRWVANIPIYTKSELAVAEEIGLKYAKIEALILRSCIPDMREIYESCAISKRFAWDDVSLIVVGGILSDLVVYDRVRFFPQYYQESMLPPLHPDGSRWEYTGYEVSERRFPAKKCNFYHDLRRGLPGGVNLAQFGYFDPDEERQEMSIPFMSSPYGTILFSLVDGPRAIDEIEVPAGLTQADVKRLLDEMGATDPPIVTLKDGGYTLNIPIFSAEDIERILAYADGVGEIIHAKVTIPCERERMEAGKRLGLRYPLDDGNLARDIALGWLVEEGLLSPIPDPPVLWNFGRWGWKGKFPMWDEVTEEMRAKAPASDRRAAD